MSKRPTPTHIATGIEDAIAHGFGSDDALRTSPRTIRVRIAVAVDHNGDWRAFGDNDCSERYCITEAANITMWGDAKLATAWIEADVPLPEETVVEGRVVV